ncbi:hypothetical protein [Streptomyces sp. NPDC021356]|uniref:hypothetical protein n=1 Tax=Streptomyces sp. NPDC021356 TaxID=3154900 RepID=UPI0034030291
MAQFLAHGFAGAIRAWVGDPATTKDDLIAAVVACAPAWWAGADLITRPTGREAAGE